MGLTYTYFCETTRYCWKTSKKILLLSNYKILVLYPKNFILKYEVTRIK